MANFITGLILLMSILVDASNSNTLLTVTLILSLSSTIFITKWGIPKLSDLRLKQIIRSEGPKVHLKKGGTPTMGGLLIVPLSLIIGNLINIQSNNYNQIFAISCITFAYMLIGILDDWKSLIHKTNKGISAKQKLLFQSIAGCGFISWAYLKGWISSDVYLFSKISIEVGIIILPIALFVLIAESNATNLTDGLDGLASGCGALVFAGLGMQLILRESNNYTELANFCMAMSGGWLGFLQYNKNPAKVFMGDTGSLAMGASLGGIALVSNSLWALLIMGGIFLMESISVILQVSIFKLTKKINGVGKRLFLMAPLHHHYELKGQKEIDIVTNFWLITILLIGIGIILRTNS